MSSIKLLRVGGSWGWLLRVAPEGGSWGWVGPEGDSWGWLLRVAPEGGSWGWVLRVAPEGGSSGPLAVTFLIWQVSYYHTLSGTSCQPWLISPHSRVVRLTLLICHVLYYHTLPRAICQLSNMISVSPPRPVCDRRHMF